MSTAKVPPEAQQEIAELVVKFGPAEAARLASEKYGTAISPQGAKHYQKRYLPGPTRPLQRALGALQAAQGGDSAPPSPAKPRPTPAAPPPEPLPELPPLPPYDPEATTRDNIDMLRDAIRRSDKDPRTLSLLIRELRSTQEDLKQQIKERLQEQRGGGGQTWKVVVYLPERRKE